MDEKRLPTENIEVIFYGKPKKEKKKKKKKKNKGMLDFGNAEDDLFGVSLDDTAININLPTRSSMSADAELAAVASGQKPAPKTRRTKKLNDETLDDKKKKKEEDHYAEYAKRYKPVLDKIDEFETEVDEFLDTRKTKLNEYENSRMKGGLNAATLITGSITSLYSTKLSAIKEKATLIGKISDFELKRIKDDAAANKGGAGDDILIQKLFTKLNDDNIVNEKVSLQEAFLSNTFDDGYEDNVLASRVKNLEGNGDIEFTDAELAFKYADRNIEMIVLLEAKTNEWRFAAIDTVTGEEISDYPVPDKFLVAGDNGDKMKFMNDGMCKDLLNRTYDYMTVDKI